MEYDLKDMTVHTDLFVMMLVMWLVAHYLVCDDACNVAAARVMLVTISDLQTKKVRLVVIIAVRLLCIS